MMRISRNKFEIFWKEIRFQMEIFSCRRGECLDRLNTIEQNYSPLLFHHQIAHRMKHSKAFVSTNHRSVRGIRFLYSNQSKILVDSFAREICNGYARAIDLDRYFQSTPTFCPNCSFPQAADKYYWFDKVIPFLPLWIALIGKISQRLLSSIHFSIDFQWDLY